MKGKSDRQNIFILCCTFLSVVTISCSNQIQSIKEDQIVQAKDNTQLIENKIDDIRLKYTSGVRSILEDTKGNIWFGSYNEGVCLLHNGELQYFTTENGLSNNQVRNIYEDKNRKKLADTMLNIKRDREWFWLRKNRRSYRDIQKHYLEMNKKRITLRGIELAIKRYSDNLI